MSVIKNAIPGASFNTEISTAAVPLTVSACSVPSGNIATITTSAAHGLTAGVSVVAFAGTTPSTYNDVNFLVLSTPTTTTFTIATSLGQQTALGTANIVFLPLNGGHFFTLGANANFQYNPDNTGTVQSDPGSNTVTGATWRTNIAASATGYGACDGYGMRVICNGSAGTSRWSKVR